MKAQLATPAAGSPAPSSAASVTAPRLASVVGDRATRPAPAGAHALNRSPRSALRVQLARPVGRAPGGPHSHPARAYRGELGDAAIHAAAARGIATPWSALPHASRIQHSFGRHDISSIRAHLGDTAVASASGMHADAYTTGNHVVIGEGTDLFTVAHEAAHVVQQRAGVQLKGGVGAAGDQYERRADAVAARVTAGQSAEALLDAYAGQSAAAPQIQCRTSIADINPRQGAAGPGALESLDPAGNPQEHAVRFGPLINGCGSAMDAWLYPSDDIKGSTPSVRPAWWTAMMTDPNTNGPWVSHNVVQGHLLNEHLGGPGNDMRNLTPFAKSTNSQHHANVERAAKSIKARKNIMRYVVEVDYTSSPPPAWFGHQIAPQYVALFAGEITCVLQEYDANTDLPIGQEYTTTISNAITGQG